MLKQKILNKLLAIKVICIQYKLQIRSHNIDNCQSGFQLNAHKNNEISYGNVPTANATQ